MHPHIRLFVVVFCVAFSLPVEGQTLRTGVGPSGRPGVFRTSTASPAIAGSWALALGFGYGWDHDVIEDGDTRYEATSQFYLGYSPWSFLTISLGAGGIISAYEESDTAEYALVVGTLGDPKIGLRTGLSLGAGFSLGGAFELWIPSGRGSFSVEGSSLSPAVDLLISFTPERVPLGIHLNFGYMHNRSALMLGNIPDILPERLLISGATSAQHHLSLDFALEYRIGPAAPYVETSANIPVGEDTGGNSSVLVGFGARFWLGPSDVVQLSLGMDFRVTDGTPTLNVVDEIFWTAPPLLNVQLGAVFRLPVPATREEGEEEMEDDVGDGNEHVETLQQGRIAGTVRCGAETCGATTRVRIGNTGASPIAPDDESGRFTTAQLTAGSYTIEAYAEGRLSQREQIEVVEGDTVEVSFNLPPATNAQDGISRIEGRVTDFQRQPVQATILIPALNIETETDEEGRFEVEAEPGQYDVIISARGFQTQHSRVQVEPSETVVMNIELRSRNRRR